MVSQNGDLRHIPSPLDGVENPTQMDEDWGYPHDSVNLHTIAIVTGICGDSAMVELT